MERLNKVSFCLLILNIVEANGLEAVLELFREPGNILVHKRAITHEFLLVGLDLILSKVGDLYFNDKASHKLASDVLSATEAFELATLDHNSHL